MTLSVTAENRDMVDETDRDIEAQVDDYVFVEMPTAFYEGDVAGISDTHITLTDFTRCIGDDEPLLGPPGVPIRLPLVDALSVDVQDRVA